jgi:hypothetical protein
MNVRYYVGMCLTGLRKTTNNRSQENRSPSRDFLTIKECFLSKTFGIRFRDMSIYIIYWISLIPISRLIHRGLVQKLVSSHQISKTLKRLHKRLLCMSKKLVCYSERRTLIHRSFAIFLKNPYIRFLSFNTTRIYRFPNQKYALYLCLNIT